MIEFLKKSLGRLLGYIEIILSCYIILVLVLLLVRIVIKDTPAIFSDSQISASHFLEAGMSIAVGVEFVKMLVMHTPGAIIEVLLFAISRHLIVTQSGPIDTIVGVGCIAALFAIRKFLFVTYDDIQRISFRAGLTINQVNMMAGVQIPGDGGEKVGKHLALELNERGVPLTVGACIYYETFALRIDDMLGDRIARIEVLKKSI